MHPVMTKSLKEYIDSTFLTRDKGGDGVSCRNAAILRKIFQKEVIMAHDLIANIELSSRIL